MNKQLDGLLGWGVDQMIRRTVKQRFRNLYWIPGKEKPKTPAIFVPNHFGWHDGYIMYHLLTKLEIPFHLWIQEYDAFPLFGKAGGLAYPLNSPQKRAATIRKTIRNMNDNGKSLLLFGEGVLHKPDELLPFGRSLELIAEKVTDATVYPVGMHYDMSMHERPECYVMVGGPLESGPDLCHRTRLAVLGLMNECKANAMQQPQLFEVFSKGTLDVNERMDMRRFKHGKSD